MLSDSKYDELMLSDKVWKIDVEWQQVWRIDVELQQSMKNWCWVITSVTERHESRWDGGGKEDCMKEEGIGITVTMSCTSKKQICTGMRQARINFVRTYKKETTTYLCITIFNIKGSYFSMYRIYF